MVLGVVACHVRRVAPYLGGKLPERLGAALFQALLSLDTCHAIKEIIIFDDFSCALRSAEIIQFSDLGKGDSSIPGD